VSGRVPTLLAIAWLAATGLARADDVQQAKARFRRGVELFGQQRWSEAAQEFEAAYRIKPHGAIHFNVAQCREQLQEWPAALRAYADYLREVPDAKDRTAVRRAMRKIEDRLAKLGAQVLLVYSDPPGARVTVAGIERGSTPIHVVLPPGGYVLELTCDGHEPAAERVQLVASASMIVDLTLKRAATPSPTAQHGADPGAGHGASAAPADAAVHASDLGQGEIPGAGHDLAGHDLAARPPPADPVRLSDAPSPRARMLPVWIAAGTAVAAAAVGLAFGAAARSDERALAGMTTPDGSQANQLAQSAQAKARTANVSFAIAGGAAVAAGALYLVEARF
jgi:hypothetical protein